MEERKEMELELAVPERNDDFEFDGDVYDLEPGSGKGRLKLAAGALLIGGAVVGGLAYKFKDKLEERKINRLRKKGYVIFKEDEVEVREMPDEEEASEEEASE